MDLLILYKPFLAILHFPVYFGFLIKARSMNRSSEWVLDRRTFEMAHLLVCEWLGNVARVWDFAFTPFFLHYCTPLS